MIWYIARRTARLGVCLILMAAGMNVVSCGILIAIEH